MADEKAALEAVEAGDAERLRQVLNDDPALAGARGEDGRIAAERGHDELAERLAEAAVTHDEQQQ